MAKNRIQSPVSGAGIMRFFDVSGGGPKISPMIIVGVSTVFIVLEVIANLLG